MSTNQSPAVTLIDAQKGLALRCFKGEKELVDRQLAPLLNKCFIQMPNGEMVSKNVNFIYDSNVGIKVISMPLIAFLGSNLITTESFKVETTYSLSTTNTTNIDSNSTDTSKTVFGSTIGVGGGGSIGWFNASASTDNTVKITRDNTVNTDTKSTSENKNSITIESKMSFIRKKDMFISDIIDSLSNIQ